MTDIHNVTSSLEKALKSDFRGFLVESDGNMEQLEVPDGELHIVIALQEMINNVDGYVYDENSPQNPIVDYMNKYSSIYITIIPTGKDELGKQNYQFTVGYLTNNYSADDVECLRQVALEAGYDVDEYTLNEKGNASDYSIQTFQCDPSKKKKYMTTKLSQTEFHPTRHISDSNSNISKLIFDNSGNLFGIIIGRKI